MTEPIYKIRQATKLGYIECVEGGVLDIAFSSSTTRRGRVQERGYISPTITTDSETATVSNYRIRKLTPSECYALMSFSKEDTEAAQSVLSNTQMYKSAGNSIVKNVLIALFSNMRIQGIQTWDDGLKDRYL